MITEAKKGIMIKVPVRVALLEDFYRIDHNMNKVRCIGLPYFVLNSQDILECYRLSSTTDSKLILELIKATRCFVFESVSLNDREAGKGEFE
jgi:hypothetical protein